jgi:hypothetical protein
MRLQNCDYAQDRRRMIHEYKSLSFLPSRFVLPLAEYNQFMKIVLSIVSIINEKSYLQQQQEASSVSAWSNTNYAHGRQRG